jgi:hypothetical protein
MTATMKQWKNLDGNLFMETCFVLPDIRNYLLP